MSLLNNEAVDLIEENLNSRRTNEICHKLANGANSMWCLSLRKCSISDSNFEKLVKSLKKCKKIRYLNFNLNIIDSFDRISHLASSITSLVYLDTLCLHSSNLKDEGLRLLSYSLMNLKNFRSLDIGDCELTDASVPYIKDLIHRKGNPSGLVELILSSNHNITSYGWMRILIAITASTDLKYVHLDYNNLDDSCGYLICALMSSNQKIEVLDFEHTGLSNKAALLILYILKNYKLVNLRCLNLLNNPIEDTILAQIRYFVKNDYEIDSLSNSTTILQAQNNLAPIATPEPSDYSFVLNEKLKFKENKHQNQYKKPVEKYTPINDSSNHYDNNSILVSKPISPTQVTTKIDLDKYNFLNNNNNNNLNDIEMLKKDQQKLDGYIKKTEKYKNQIDQDPYVLERSLEQDFDTLLRYQRKFIQNQNEMIGESSNAHNDELMEPFDDFRFKTHNVLPFNINN